MYVELWMDMNVIQSKILCIMYVNYGFLNSYRLRRSYLTWVLVSEVFFFFFLVKISEVILRSIHLLDTSLDCLVRVLARSLPALHYILLTTFVWQRKVKVNNMNLKQITETQIRHTKTEHSKSFFPGSDHSAAFNNHIEISKACWVMA